MASASLKVRYAWKLLTNLVGIPISMAMLAIVTRGLGPSAYGDFSYLTNFFSQAIGFVQSGTCICFYTKLSQRQKEIGLVTFYLYFMIAVFAIIIAGIAAICAVKMAPIIWPSQMLTYVIMAAVFAMIMWFSEIIGQMADAYGVTVASEKYRMLQRIIGLVLIGLIFYWKYLNLTSYFISQYIILSFLILALIFAIKRENCTFQFDWKLKSNQVYEYLREFYHYSSPLLVYSLVSLLINIFDRWMLQIFGGSEQQGYFGLSTQVASACFLFTSAMSPLLTREFSIAHGNKDLKQMARLFRRYIPMLYTVASVMACFIAIQAGKIVSIMGGQSFKGATIAISIMSFYAIHQTYGQLSGSVFYASGQTTLYRNIGIVSLLFGIPLTYFMLAPNGIFGLNAGSTGLAIKMVAINILAVNVQLWFNARYLNLAFWKYVAHQIVTVAVFVSMAWFIAMIVDLVIKSTIASLLVSGTIYVIGCITILLICPAFFSLSRSEIMKMFKDMIVRRSLFYQSAKMETL